jgi:hypothetical protein
VADCWRPWRAHAAIHLWLCSPPIARPSMAAAGRRS